MDFPSTPEALVASQRELAALTPEPFRPPSDRFTVGAVFVCFGRGEEGPGNAGDRGWAAAVVLDGRRIVDQATVGGQAGAPYAAGLLALREGPMLAAAVASLRIPFHVLMVNATGRDHPRRAGLAFHLGAILATPTIGVTHRPLLAEGSWPGSRQRGARSPLRLGDEVVGCWLRTGTGLRPLAVHAAWRTDPDLAADLALDSARVRTPEPLRAARRLARSARAGRL